jgi:hypothetical protein
MVLVQKLALAPAPDRQWMSFLSFDQLVVAVAVAVVVVVLQPGVVEGVLLLTFTGNNNNDIKSSRTVSWTMEGAGEEMEDWKMMRWKACLQMEMMVWSCDGTLELGR